MFNIQHEEFWGAHNTTKLCENELKGGNSLDHFLAYLMD